MTTVAAAPWAQYICHACGYIYKEAEGDPDSGLAAGTRFADIPDDWSCPLCGVTKADFELYLAPGMDALRASAARTSGTGASSASRRTPLGVVIVGAGRAGWQTAEALRAHDPTVPITLVTACAGDVYDKPMLSIGLARKITPEGFVKETGVDAARRLGVRLMAYTHAVRVCADTMTLRTTRGNLRYRHLVLAHGAQAALPPALPAAMCWRINHLGAYQKLRQALGTTPQDVVIVGAGLVGSELANDLALAGHRITLMDVEAEPLARWSDQQAGSQLLAAWQHLPIRFVGHARVSRVDRVGDSYRVSTTGGQRFVAAQIIVATGLKTPGRLARSAGLDWNEGIAVDAASLQTNVPGIHALGDCITVNGQASRFIEPITRQARTVAAAICGAPPVPYENRPMAVRVKTTTLPLTLH